MSFTLKWNLDPADIREAGNRAARDGAEHIRGVAVDRTPVETGTLRATAKVTTDGQGTAAVSYNTPYAARQHEEVGWAHPGGGQAKFLESAMRSETDTVRAIAAEAIRKAIGGR